jgi:hypothetical protein
MEEQVDPLFPSGFAHLTSAAVHQKNRVLGVCLTFAPLMPQKNQLYLYNKNHQNLLKAKREDEMKKNRAAERTKL